MDRFGRSLRFCNIEFETKAISVGYMAHSRVLGGGGGILSDFRELSFCGPCEPYLNLRYYFFLYF